MQYDDLKDYYCPGPTRFWHLLFILKIMCFEAVLNFRDDMFRDLLRESPLDELQELLDACIKGELFEQANIVKEEIARREAIR